MKLEITQKIKKTSFLTRINRGLSFLSFVHNSTQLPALCQRSMDCLNFPPKLASDHQIFLQASQRKLMQIWGAHSTHLCLTRYIIKE